MRTSRSAWARRRALSLCLCAAAALGAACARAPGESEGWLSPLGRDDPLVGRIYDTARAESVTRDELLARARLSDFVLLGEKHDNADHHRLQAAVIQSLAREGLQPAIAFEMLSSDDRPKLELWRQTHPESVDALRDILDWQHSGWPDFELYRPVFLAAISRQLAIVPANLGSRELAALRGGLGRLPAERRHALGLDEPLSEEARESLADDIRESHCGMADERMVAAMVDVQRARDATLADALLRAGAPALLVAGAGHVRRDRAVPLYLARRAPERRVLAIAFVEVGCEAQDPRDFAGAFDLVWFTPRVDDKDPCARFREQLEKLHHKAPNSGV